MRHVSCSVRRYLTDLNLARTHMISRDQIQTLIDRPAGEKEILSLFLDMSVNANNKREHQLFLNREKARFAELDSDRENHHREAVGEAFARIENWLDSDYDEARKGVALYVEIGGDWFQAHQVSVPLPNRLVISDRPAVGPLVEILERYHHHGIVIVDREHLRLQSLFLDQTLNEREVETDPFPAAHDVRRGGFSAKDYQSRKEEETRHFFKEFADEVQDFVRRFEPQDLILLGTQENVKKFQDHLPDALRKMIVHTDRIEIEASAAQVREKVGPVLDQHLQQREAHAVDRLRDRVKESHLAVAGRQQTLEQLQEGKLDTLVIARGLEAEGGRCSQCGFVLGQTSGDCPYCGGAVSNSLDLGEEMVRLAQDQGLEIAFVDGRAVQEYEGVGGLLRF